MWIRVATLWLGYGRRLSAQQYSSLHSRHTRNGNWACSNSLTVYTIFSTPQGMIAYPVMGMVSVMLLVPTINIQYIRLWCELPLLILYAPPPCNPLLVAPQSQYMYIKDLLKLLSQCHSTSSTTKFLLSGHAHSTNPFTVASMLPTPPRFHHIYSDRPGRRFPHKNTGRHPSAATRMGLPLLYTQPLTASLPLQIDSSIS